MARQISVELDIETLRFPSWVLCRLLDRLNGTKEEVTFRRKYSTMYFYMQDVFKHYKQLFSGSEGEGFNFASSDIDLMHIDRDILVLESIHDTLAIDDRKTVLLMKREGCSPGFVILQSLSRTKHRNIGESIVEYHGHPVVSSLLYRDVHKQAEYGQVGHGPCNTFQEINGKTDIDIAYCFECNKWPTEANEFIHRQRLHGWPEKALLDKIICRGCHLVPIGDKNHDLSYIQWRLSFSAAEKDLVHSFNHTQFLVYGVLKLFLKQFINKFQLPDGILCSYFLKTAMFYSIESTPSSFWRDDLLIPCFWLSINKLITWVEEGYCPNYFVPQNNMFRNKVFGQHRHNLLCAFNQCKRVGWMCIYLCENLQVLQYVSYPETLYRRRLTPTKKEQEYLLDSIAVDFLIDPHYSNEEEMRQSLVHSLTLLSHSRTQKENEFSILQLYNVLRNIGLTGFCTDDSNSNKNRYKTLRKCQRLLSTSSEGLGYVGMFSMATFYFLIGQYQKAIQILENSISMWKQFMMYDSVRKSYHGDLYQHYACGRGISLNDKVRFAFVRDIYVYPDKKSFYPVEFHYDIEAPDPFLLFIPPLPYTVFLLFLCHHKLGNIGRSLSVLHHLEVLTRDEIQGRQYPVVLNMLAICLDKLGIRHRAVEMCLLSQEIKSDKNGAERLLDKILSDVF